EEMNRLLSDLSLIPSAVEEMLRYESPSQHTGRLAPEDVELGGKLIRKRQAVMAVMAAANRDPERFPDPDRFDITRSDNRHLAFGYAAHFCFGAPLARAEGQVAFESLLRRFPSIELCPQKFEWRTNSGLRGLKSLKLNFGNSRQNGDAIVVETAQPSARSLGAAAAQQDAIADYLRGGFAHNRIQPRTTKDPVRLSCAQEQIWLHIQMAPEVPMYNEAVVID